MELSERLRRLAAGRPHALLAVAPGATDVRLAVERELRERGWPVGGSPAAADLLVVCGAPDAPLEEAFERAWAQLPSPRCRLELREPDEAGAALDGVRALLSARADPRPTRPQVQPSKEDGGGHHHQHHGGGGEGEDEMVVAGLPLAERAPDRDGLKLDQLELPLGPVLADWPAGLVLRTWIQGDVVQEAEVELLGGATGDPFWTEPWQRAARGEAVTRGEASRRLAAAHLDSAGRLLALAGAGRTALAARLARDTVLGAAGTEEPRRAVAGLRSALGRSRLLRWSLAGLGPLSAARAEALRIEGAARRADGDAWARLLRWVDEAGDAVDGIEDDRLLDLDEAPAPPRGSLAGSRALLDAIPELVTGMELGGARLIVASLDPDLDELAAAPVPAHG